MSPGHEIISTALQEGRSILTELEAKKLLDLYDIPTVPSLFAVSPAEAAVMAESLGFPVVVKVVSKTITHKTDVGGVRLNLAASEEVRSAFDSIKSSILEKVLRLSDIGRLKCGLSSGRSTLRE